MKGFCSLDHFPLFQKKYTFRLGDRMRYFDLETMGLPSQSFVFLVEKGLRIVNGKWKLNGITLSKVGPTQKVKQEHNAPFY